MEIHYYLMMFSLTTKMGNVHEYENPSKSDHNFKQGSIRISGTYLFCGVHERGVNMSFGSIVICFCPTIYRFYFLLRNW